MLFIDFVRVSIFFLLSSHAVLRSQNNDHLFFPAAKNKNNTKQTDRQEQKKRAGHPSPQFSQKKEYQYIRFSKEWLPTFPPGSNCLFSSLASSLSLGLLLICRKTVFDEAKRAIGLRPDNEFFEGKSCFSQI